VINDIEAWKAEIDLCTYLPELFRIFERVCAECSKEDADLTTLADLKLRIAVRWIQRTQNVNAFGKAAYEEGFGNLVAHKLTELNDAVKKGVRAP